MTWRKSTVNTFNLQSINGPCFILCSVFSFSAFLSLSLFHSSLHLFLYSKLLLQLYSYLIVSPPFNHFLSINVEHKYLVWIIANFPFLPLFILPSLSNIPHISVNNYMNQQHCNNELKQCFVSLTLPYLDSCSLAVIAGHIYDSKQFVIDCFIQCNKIVTLPITSWWTEGYVYWNKEK